MFLFLFLSTILARQVIIDPHKAFEFYDYVETDAIYKFKYSTHNDVEITLLDPANRVIYKGNAKTASLFVNPSSDGRVKVIAQNKLKIPMEFSYKSPDPNKELLGHLGYIKKDADLISELVRILDQYVAEQSKLVERTIEQKKKFRTSRFWIRIIIGVEFCLSAVGAYFIHKSFVSMFEKKQTL